MSSASLVITVIIGAVVAVVVVQGIPLQDDTTRLMQSTTSNQQDKSITENLLDKCSAKEGAVGFLNCAASRVLKSVKKAETQPNVEIIPGVSLINENPISRTGKEINDDENTLPSDPQTRASKLLSLIVDASARFLSTRTLTIKLPATTQQNLARALEEGRGKMKKMMGPLMLGLGAKMITIIPIMLGGLALLAAKALLIGKLAFVISIILFVQYFFSGRSPIMPIGGSGVFGGLNGYGYGYGGSTYGSGTYGSNSLGGWGPSAQYPYARRSLDVSKDAAQDLAYSSHK